MKIEIGDKVRFLNEVGGGVVSRIVGGKLVYVLDNEGFEIPVLLNEVVLVEKKVVYNSGEGLINEGAANEKAYQFEESEEEGDPKVLLSFIKQKGNAEWLSMYLVNDSNFYLMYTIGVVEGELVNNLYTGTIEPNTKVEVEQANLHFFSDKEFVLQLLMYRKGFGYKHKEPISKRIKLSGVKLIKTSNYLENDFFAEKAYSVYVVKSQFEKKLDQLTDKEIHEVIKEKEKSAPIKKEKKKGEEGIVEIDLHIHELLDDDRGLSNKEILDIQMEKFHNVMNAYKNNKNQKIVFIHGVGNGVLKSEIRKTLERKYKWHSFQDASFKEYGFGATMVVI